MYITVVVPLFRCNVFVEELCKRLIKTLELITQDYEIILVNDHSPANDWEMVINACTTNKNIKGIDLSRNFGQHYAITAGLANATGEWIVVMDGDLQDQPEEITKLHQKAIEGFDLVLARRQERKDSFIKRKGSELFYKTLAYLTDTEQNAEVANFGIYNQKVIKAILSMHDKIRYFPTMVKWVGFKNAEVIVEHCNRSNGKSSYTLKGLIDLALNTILAFSDKPLRLTMKLGILISSFSFAFAVYNFWRAITGHNAIMGYSSLIISIWFLSGVIITLLGLIGLYIGRIFDQVKNRPVFIISETLNID